MISFHRRDKGHRARMEKRVVAREKGLISDHLEWSLGSNESSSRDEHERRLRGKKELECELGEKRWVVLAKVIFRLDELVYFAIHRGEISLSCLRRRFSSGCKLTASLLYVPRTFIRQTSFCYLSLLLSSDDFCFLFLFFYFSDYITRPAWD